MFARGRGAARTAHLLWLELIQEKDQGFNKG